MALQGKFKEVGDALLTWWGNKAAVQALSLVTLAWGKNMQAAPVFPCNPATQCPRGVLRGYTENHEFDTTIGCETAKFVYQYSLWLQLSQTPGQSHQELLIAKLGVFRDAILQSDFRPELGVSGVELTALIPNQLVIHDESVHPLGTLRVSNGEVNVTVAGRLYNPEE